MKPAFLLLVPLLALPAAALEPNQSVYGRDRQGDTYTLGWPNGRYWNTLNESAKPPFLTGIESGMDYLATELAGLSAFDKGRPAITAKIKQVSVSAFRPEEVALAVDEFYREPANVLVPVPYAVQTAAMKLTGTSAGKIASYTEVLRAFWAKQAGHRAG